MTRLLAAVGVLTLAPFAAAADATAVSVAYFTPGSPCVLRFNVSLDGKPVEEGWGKAVDSLFAFLDRNGDGKLNEDERAKLIRLNGRSRRGNDPTIDADGSELAGRLTFDPAAEFVDRAAFGEALKNGGFGPVNVQFVGGRPESAQLTTALFRHLDADGDGKLSAAELAAARSRLEVFDVNEDEWLTSPELLARAVTANRQFVVPGRRQADEPQPANPNDLLVLNGQSLKAVKQLLAARGKPKATTLDPTEMGMDATAFARFDRDGNGHLDTDELLDWLKQTPVLTVEITLTSDAAKTAAAKPLGLAVAAGSRFDVSNPTGTAGAEWTATASALRAAFKAAAEKGVVEKGKLKGQPLLSQAFTTIDRNADEKIDEKELTTALDAVAPLAVCRAEIVIADQGRGLFEVIDANGDGQLSPRELVELPQAIKAFAAADGSVTKGQVPRSLPVRSSSVGLRLLGTTQAARDVLEFNAGMQDRPRPGRGTSGPAWFVKMDRNGDGDVSRKEFLGPLELFRKLDANGDGLISAEEAKAAKE